MDLTLAGIDGIPNVDGLDDYEKNRILALDQLGTSFENLCKRCAKQFSLTTVLMIGDRMQGIIEWVHSCGVLHRDVQPQNFLVGCGQFRNTICLIDFGRSAPYLDQRKQEYQICTHKHPIYTHKHAIYAQKSPNLHSTNTKSLCTSTQFTHKHVIYMHKHAIYT
jgi:serine/threonine protein kinase